MEKVIIDNDYMYRILLGQICSGMIASGRKDDNEILEEAKCWAKVIMHESYNDNKINNPNRKTTGFFDATGKPILDGDIFIYDVWQFNGQVPDDLISNYNEKYSEIVSLHPVFWDSDEGMWASEVYRDADKLGKYDFSKLYVVTDNIEHPELYNH